MAELNSFFEIAIAPRRNAMRARYKDRSENSTNGVGMITPLQKSIYHLNIIFLQPWIKKQLLSSP